MKKVVALGIALATLACADQTALEPQSGVSAVMADRAPDPGVCHNLSVPAGHQRALHVYAHGAQVYRWNGTSWAFVAPDAVLTADAAGHSKVGDHYAGPTWRTLSGSKVVAAVAERCTPDPHSIPWLLLTAQSSEGPGVLNGVTFIQRIHTSGGNAPAQPGGVVGQEARVAYTTEYVFYRRH